MLVKVELLPRDEQTPVDHAHVEALELADVVVCDAADGRNVLIRVVDVVVHFGGHENCRQNQPKNSEKRIG